MPIFYWFLSCLLTSQRNVVASGLFVGDMQDDMIVHIWSTVCRLVTSCTEL